MSVKMSRDTSAKRVQSWRKYGLKAFGTDGINHDRSSDYDWRVTYLAFDGSVRWREVGQLLDVYDISLFVFFHLLPIAPNTAPQSGIQQVSQRIAEHICAEDKDTQGNTRPNS